MAFEIRRGIVRGLGTRGEAVGRTRQSIAVFRLDGTLSRYPVGSLDWGTEPNLPAFHDGDEIVASGEMSPDAIFLISNIYVIRLNKIIGDDYAYKIFLGCFITFPTMIEAKKQYLTSGGNRPDLALVFLYSYFGRRINGSIKRDENLSFSTRRHKVY